MRNKTLTALLSKEVDRKEFLLYIGLLFIALTGISGFLKTISTITQGQTKPEKGFGSGGYGL